VSAMRHGDGTEQGVLREKAHMAVSEPGMQIPRGENMRIENININAFERMSESDLRYLRSRCLNIFDRYFAGTDVQKAVDMDRKLFLTKYLLLRTEMESRGIKLFRDKPLDKEVHNRIFKSSLWKLDVPALGDMVAIPNYVSVCGGFIKSPVTTEKIDVVIRSNEEHRNERFETKIGELVKEQTNKEPNFIYEPKGPDESYIPLFDLVLKSHDETRKVKMKKGSVHEGEKFDINKPYPNEHSCRLKAPGAFKPESFRRIERATDGKRYSIVMGRLKGEVTMSEQAYRYPQDTWTEAQARAHCKDHDGILFEPGKEKREKFQIKKPEETETTIRIPVGPECEVTATITIDKAQGITAFYCGKIKKIRTYQFDKRVKAWTMASAKTWVKEHKEKTEKVLEKGTNISKKKSLAKTEKDTTFKIIKIDKAKRLAGGIVYEPGIEDTQGDLASKEEIEKALTSFMKRYATDTKRIKINHKGKRYFFPIIESFIPDTDIVKGSETIPAGAWWLMIHISNDKIWQMVENKELEGFSMGGRSKARA